MRQMQHYVIFPNHDNGMRLYQELKKQGTLAVKRGQGEMQIGTPTNAIGDVHLCKRCTSPINNIGLSLD